ncbi:hypothetical protein Tco_0119946 [Tanacetum coccineum]
MLTRSMAKEFGATLAHECLFIDFLSEEEPKKVSEALQLLGWVDSMQDELNKFTRNKVWTLVPAPYGKTIIGSKWVFRNKRDETGIVIKNKARLNHQIQPKFFQEEHIPKQEPNTEQKARPPSPNPFEPAPQVEFNFDEISFNANNEATLLYPSHLKSEYFKVVSDFISKCCLRESFTRAPHKYKEYLSKF